LSYFLDHETEFTSGLVSPFCHSENGTSPSLLANLVFMRGVNASGYGILLLQKAYADFLGDWGFSAESAKAQEDFSTQYKESVRGMERQKVEMIQKIKPNECVSTGVQAHAFEMGEMCALNNLTKGRDLYVSSYRRFCPRLAENHLGSVVACEAKSDEAYLRFAALTARTDRDVPREGCD
jgi:hypothetical protein